MDWLPFRKQSFPVCIPKGTLGTRITNEDSRSDFKPAYHNTDLTEAHVNNYPLVPNVPVGNATYETPFQLLIPYDTITVVIPLLKIGLLNNTYHHSNLFSA